QFLHHLWQFAEAPADILRRRLDTAKQTPDKTVADPRFVDGFCGFVKLVVQCLPVRIALRCLPVHNEANGAVAQGENVKLKAAQHKRVAYESPVADDKDDGLHSEESTPDGL